MMKFKEKSKCLLFGLIKRENKGYIPRFDNISGPTISTDIQQGRIL